jgi:hypothetical protein
MPRPRIQAARTPEINIIAGAPRGSLVDGRLRQAWIQRGCLLASAARHESM